MKSDTHMITEGAMMTALVGVALFINRQFAGILEYAMYWVLSFPILIYTVRYGIKKALVPAVSMLLLAMIIAMPTTVFYLASALLCGLVYGGGVRKKWSNGRLLGAVGILTLVSYLITMVLFAAVFGYDPAEDILIAQKLVEVLHIGSVNIGQIALLFSILTTVVTAVLQTICVHLFAILIMRRMKIAMHPVKTIFDMEMPKAIGYISICIWLLFLLRNVIKLEGNIMVVCASAYICVCILMAAESIMSLMCFGILWKKRGLVFLFLFTILFMMMGNITRNIVLVFGIYSCITQMRTRIKEGVYHGTIGKS